MITTLNEYIDSVNESGKEWLTEFYDYMKLNYDNIKPVMFRQRPMFKIGKSYIMFTAAKEHFSVHTMNFELIEKYKNKIPNSGNSKGCLNIKYSNASAKPLLKELCDKVIEINDPLNPQTPEVIEITYEEHLENVFPPSKKKCLPLYESLRSHANKNLPEFKEHFPAVGILWKHSSTFAGFKIKKNSIQIEFYSDKLHNDRNPVKHLQTSINRVMHMVELENGDKFDLLIEWIKESYYLTKK